MTRAAWLLGVFTVLSACTSAAAGRGSSSPTHAPADVVAAGDGDVRWSIAVASNDKDHDDQKIAWSSAVDNDGADDGSVRVVCAFDALRVHVDWQLPRQAAGALVKQSVRTKRRYNRANGQDNNVWEACIYSSLFSALEFARFRLLIGYSD